MLKGSAVLLLLTTDRRIASRSMSPLVADLRLGAVRSKLRFERSSKASDFKNAWKEPQSASLMRFGRMTSAERVVAAHMKISSCARPMLSNEYRLARGRRGLLVPASGESS